MRKKSPSRKISRAPRTDGEATSRRILEAAGELFAASGFADTQNKAIAARARVDLASINYHYGSRSGLYQAVLAEAHRRIISLEKLQELAAAADLPASEKLRKIIERLLEGIGEHQGWHTKVFGREVLSPSPHLQVFKQKEILPKLQVLLGILGEITGIPANDPALFRCLISVAAPCAMLLIAGRENSPFADEIRRMLHEDLVAHLHRFAMGGLDAIRQEVGMRPRGTTPTST